MAETTYEMVHQGRLMICAARRAAAFGGSVEAAKARTSRHLRSP